MTKGGVMYHFRTKEDLVRAVFSHVLDTRRAAVERHLTADGEPTTVARQVAYVTATIGEPSRPEELSLFVDALRVDELRHLWTEADGSAPEGSEFDTASIDAQLMRFAADGLWMLESLGVVTPTEAQRRALIERATELITDNRSSAPRP